MSAEQPVKMACGRVAGTRGGPRREADMIKRGLCQDFRVYTGKSAHKKPKFGGGCGSEPRKELSV